MQEDVKTITPEASAFMWMAIEHEMSVLVAGGTASGKTTMLNALMPFMPANQRILSLEDTRELNLPEYLQWVPLTVRPPTPEGEGEVSMLNLLQNSLRMRPDRVIVGEVRAKRETEVLFEAMHTGHSVYSTFHAERAQEVVDRITNPPMNIPTTVLHSLQLIMVQFRNRRTRQRRTFEIVELMKDEEGKTALNTVFQWDPKTDQLVKRRGGSMRVKNELSLFSGYSDAEIDEDLANRQLILEWMMKQGIKSVNDVGKLITEY
jgi:flagellar protein FlaI